MSAPPNPPAPDTTPWDRLKRLFADTLERPPGERAVFLDAACAGDSGLRAEVEGLLAAEPEAEEALDRWADRLAPIRALADAPEAAAPVQIGPYRLVREVGRGGMGTVFLAERADGQYRQRVALKLIRAGAASGEVQRRFRAERQILARLAHPHIARLLDGGVTPPAPDAPDGLPYLVMEYVEGETLLAYSDARRLDLDARLDLFLAVCDGVQSAHQALVVHRDLKPSNVLVTSDGKASVKLLDFGIAKLLNDGDEDGDGLPLTRPHHRLMTPAYAAPEQMRGEPVTTATDVYSLGVLLYELLSGHRPFALEGRTPAEVERVLDTTEPARPSTVLLRTDAPATAEARADTPTRLARRLCGDLDTIVLKALQREPARRYPSVAELADDLRRHRGHLPVHARPDTVAYRTGRFVRRHRLGVAATALVLFAVLGGTGAALWQAGVARAEARKAEETLAFIESALTTADPNTGDPETPIRAVLDRSAAHLDERFGDQPLVAASVHHTVGKAYLGLGLLNRAGLHLGRATALFAAAGPRYRPDHAEALVNLAITRDYEGRTPEAVRLYEQALALARRAGRPDVEASALNALGSALATLGQTDEAEARYGRAIALWRAAGAESLPIGLNNLAVLYESVGRGAEALPLLREAVAAQRARHSDPRGHPDLARALASLAATYESTGDFAEAASTYHAALAMLDRTLGPDHPDALTNATTRAILALRLGQPADAHRLARRTYDGARRTLPAANPIRSYTEAVLGQSLCEMSADSARAGEALVRRALAAREGQLPPGHWLLASTRSVLGGCLLAQQRYAEAAPLLLSGYEDTRAARGDGDARTASARQRLAAYYTAVGLPAGALRERR